MNTQPLMSSEPIYGPVVTTANAKRPRGETRGRNALTGGNWYNVPLVDKRDVEARRRGGDRAVEVLERDAQALVAGRRRRGGPEAVAGAVVEAAQQTSRAAIGCDVIDRDEAGRGDRVAPLDRLADGVGAAVGPDAQPAG